MGQWKDGAALTVHKHHYQQFPGFSSLKGNSIKGEWLVLRLLPFSYQESPTHLTSVFRYRYGEKLQKLLKLLLSFLSHGALCPLDPDGATIAGCCKAQQPSTTMMKAFSREHTYRMVQSSNWKVSLRLPLTLLMTSPDRTCNLHSPVSQYSKQCC